MCSPINVVVSKSSGKHRVTTDFSSYGSKVNDGISNEDIPCKLASFDMAVEMCISAGQGCFMAKDDISNAYRNIKVFPDDVELLGIFWSNRFFFDLFLPFGLRSSAGIFDLFAKLLSWIALNHGVEALFNYLDDFFMCHQSKVGCNGVQSFFEDLCRQLGVPINADKKVTATQVIEFLGLIIDSILQQVRISAERLLEIKELLESWVFRKKCTKVELLSLIGVLGFAAKAVKPGRIFLRRMINLSTVVTAPHHLVYLNSAFHKDLNWWRQFISDWNGVTFFHNLGWVSNVDLQLFVDASNVGYGCYWDGIWFHQRWEDVDWPYILGDIAWKELFALVASAVAWGEKWRNKNICFRSDSQVVVDVLRSGSTACDTFMDLVRILHFEAAENSFQFSVTHIEGTRNSIADSLSRFQVARFRELAPQADHDPCPIPQLNSLLYRFE
eukprot:Lithocolla_globosa_v1_NODE_1500_length_2529_cov_15.569119.p1 type:complete len:442 gc:universal NODE_1500_length_2529_cov_15.569119:472-1797(+)